MRRYLETFSIRALSCSSALVSIAVLSWAGLAAEDVFAQDGTADSIVLETIVLNAKERSTAPIDGYVAQTSSSGTKTDTPILQTPQSLSVVSATEIRDRDARTLADVLSYTPSFTAQPRTFSRVADRFRIRGFDVEPGTGGLLRDGMRLQNNSYDGTQEPFGLERVDVVRGASSVLYGQLSPGGFINGVSKRPTDEPLREIGFEGGSHNRKQLTADFSDAITDTLSYRLTVMGRDSDTNVDAINDDRFYIAPALEWSPDEDTSLTVLGFYQHSSTRFSAPIPYQLIEGIGNGPSFVGRDEFIGEPGYDRMASDMSALGYEFEHRFDNDLRFSSKSRYYQTDLDWRYLMAQTGAAAINTAATTGMLARQYSDRHDRARGFTHDTNIELDVETGPLSHSLVMGYDFYDTNYDSDNFRAAVAPINLNDPVYGTGFTIDRSPARNRGGETETTQHGVYFQDKINFYGRWNVLLGLRHDWADQKFTAHRNGDSVSRDTQETTWRAGLVYEAENGLAPYVSYAQSFFPVSVADYTNNANFDPTTGEQIEAGIRYQPPGTDMLFSAAVYQLTQDNVVSGNLAGDLTQIGQQRARGLELEVKADLTDDLTMVASYSYTDARITRSEVASEIGRRSEDTPYHQASLWLTYDFARLGMEGLSIGGGIRYKGETKASGIDRPIPGYALVDALVRYDVDENVSLSLNATNLFGKDYAYCEFAICRYGDGREIMASARIRW
ncbi:iron complex outermembrane receptor protein [Phyllobacterium ifriqiyense]|uniref:Iron complex outermembrane receptor protein n=1 Tax=Phyllobacterium ifriqiyense TaxID=314238 RepID=A0ABU0S5S6_9HYPH|nr:TonB-dependent siderophore receptor [Phyllobacterium ifriqiyense]MDQ0996117.1 iron complex outermembrane receptor protein [Phyllobacterium ifriqiyense]